MKKLICILTINDNNNYGNRLQNYALQQMLRQYGKVTTVNQINWTPSKIAYFTKTAKHLIKNLVLWAQAQFSAQAKAKLLRQRRFSKFIKKYVPCDLVQDTAYSGATIEKGVEVDKVVIGSDQVWNYTFGLSREDLRMRLGCDFESKKLLSYAASLGIDKINPKMLPIFKEELPRISHISVREFAAKKALQPLTKTDIEVVLDPTLMIPDTEWTKIFPNSVDTNERYVVTYFLGELSQEQKNIIHSYAQARSLTIKNINDLSDLDTYSAGPREFVELIAKSDFVFTDSYHACCFSIIFKKSFRIFNRKTKNMQNMNSRISTLFRLFNLCDDFSGDEIIDTSLPEIRTLLEQHQASSRAWLDKAIKSSN